MNVAVAAHHSMIADQIEFCNYFLILKIGSRRKIKAKEAFSEKSFDVNEFVKILLFNNVKAIIVNKIEESTSDSFKANNIRVIKDCEGNIYEVLEKIITSESISESNLEVVSEKNN